MVCQSWVADSAGLGRGFLVRCGSRVLRGWGVSFWLGVAETEWGLAVGVGVGGVGDVGIGGGVSTFTRYYALLTNHYVPSLTR